MRGKSILYISHRLNEVKTALRCRKTVLRHGKVVGDCNPQVETASSLARMMVGNDNRQCLPGSDGGTRFRQGNIDVP